MMVPMTLAAAVNGQITRTATFENFTVGQEFKPSFTDPLSGITFTSSTGPTQDFDVDHGLSEYNYSNYLRSFSTPGPGWTSSFGFTRDLPSAADQVSLQISWTGVSYNYSGGISLEGFDAGNSVVVHQAAANTEPDPFILQIVSPDYEINSFKIIALGVATDYDNISYTILPELTEILGLFVAVGFSLRRRRMNV